MGEVSVLRERKGVAEIPFRVMALAASMILALVLALYFRALESILFVVISVLLIVHIRHFLSRGSEELKLSSGIFEYLVDGKLVSNISVNDIESIDAESLKRREGDFVYDPLFIVHLRSGDSVSYRYQVLSHSDVSKISAMIANKNVFPD